MRNSFWKDGEVLVEEEAGAILAAQKETRPSSRDPSSNSSGVAALLLLREGTVRKTCLRVLPLLASQQNYVNTCSCVLRPAKSSGNQNRVSGRSISCREIERVKQASKQEPQAKVQQDKSEELKHRKLFFVLLVVAVIGRSGK